MKTTETDADVGAYLAGLGHRGRAADAAIVIEIMERASGAAPRMWGDSIVGFGAYEYERRDGTSHRWMLTGVAPRASALSVYLMDGTASHGEQLARLGPHKTAVSCLYLGRLTKIDLDVLERIIVASVEEMRRRHL